MKTLNQRKNTRSALLRGMAECGFDPEAVDIQLACYEVSYVLSLIDPVLKAGQSAPAQQGAKGLRQIVRLQTLTELALQAVAALPALNGLTEEQRKSIRELQAATTPLVTWKHELSDRVDVLTAGLEEAYSLLHDVLSDLKKGRKGNPVALAREA